MMSGECSDADAKSDVAFSPDLALAEGKSPGKEVKERKRRSSSGQFAALDPLDPT
jgi:hypothetical protein